MVAVIGTLLALLVFFALFGIFVVEFVPLWMTDNEAQFTNYAATSFAQFKGGIDTQYALGGPPALGTTFTLTSNGVPLFAQGTQGVLNFVPQTCTNGFYVRGTTGASPSNYGQPVSPSFCVFENQSISAGPGGSRPFFLSAASGTLQMFLPNRYYTSETFYFEDDGVIQMQEPGYQVLAFPPPFNVTRIASNTTVTSSFLQLYGNATTVISQGSEELYSHLRYTQDVTSNGYNTTARAFKPFNYTFEVGTEFPCAWARFLRSQMNASGLPYALNPTAGTTSYNWTDPVNHTATVPYVGSCNNPFGMTVVLILNIFSLSYVNLFYAGAQVTIGIGGT